MSNIIDIKEKIDRLSRQDAAEEENRRREIGRRAEDYVHRYVSIASLSLAVTSIIISIIGLVVTKV